MKLISVITPWSVSSQTKKSLFCLTYFDSVPTSRQEDPHSPEKTT